jgi:hypothetical protein
MVQGHLLYQAAFVVAPQLGSLPGVELSVCRSDNDVADEDCDGWWVQVGCAGPPDAEGRRGARGQLAIQRLG